MSRLKIKPATRADLEAFYGEHLDRTVYAYVGEKDGEVLGLGGYYLNGDSIVMFSDIKPDGRDKKMTIVRIIKIIMKAAKKYRLPILAVPDPDYERSCEMLLRLGFENFGGTYIWHSSPQR